MVVHTLVNLCLFSKNKNTGCRGRQPLQMNYLIYYVLIILYLYILLWEPI